MGIEMELGPVMDDQGGALIVLGDAVTGGRDQRLGQLRQRDAGVGVEPPGGLSAGERRSGPGNGTQAGGQLIGGSQMFLDQPEIAPLQARVIGGQC
jgi:hypothetical protein